MNNYDKCKSIVSFICYKGLFLCALTVMMLSVSYAQQATKSEDSQSLKQNSKIYTAFNMWYEHPRNMSCVNYKKGTLIPAGTEVSNIAIEDESESNIRSYIEFWSKEDRKLFQVKCQSRFRPRKTLKDYMNLMFTNKPLDLLTEGFTSLELEAIRNGSIVEGMSKKAVIVSVGIPPGHYTHSLDANSWLYWKSRFRKRKICFDSHETSIDCKKVTSNNLLN